jgi:hypothetical protein
MLVTPGDDRYYGGLLDDELLRVGSFSRGKICVGRASTNSIQ